MTSDQLKSYRKEHDKIMELWRKGKYDKAYLNSSSCAYFWDSSSRFKLLAGMMIQWCDTWDDDDATTAESFLLEAMDLDPESLQAALELFHYYDKVADKKRKAAKYLKKFDEIMAELVEERSKINQEGK